MHPLGFLALILVGFAGAVINVIAAGGSFLTLPLLIFLGLPPSVANGTNRVGVLAQNVTAAVGFHRHQMLPLPWAAGAALPAMAGAAVGVWAALNVPELAFRRILALIMLAVAFGTLLYRSKVAPRADARSASDPTVMGGFFLAGIYGGFVQAGVGFLVLALTTFAGLDLVRGNAVKVFAVMLLTLLSLAGFAAAGQVDWPAGLALGAGNLLGGIVGVRLAVLKGQQWLEPVVLATIAVFAVLLWVTG